MPLEARPPCAHSAPSLGESGVELASQVWLMKLGKTNSSRGLASNMALQPENSKRRVTR